MRNPRKIPLAVVGMSCRLPRADGVDEFWRLLVEGRSAVAELPGERFNRELYYDPKKGVRGKSYTTIGCLVDYPPPDLTSCPLTEEQVAFHDKAHVTMAEIASKACINAGLDPFAMPKARVGVYVGHTRGSPLGGESTYAHLVEHTAQYLREVSDFSARTGSNVDEVIDEIVSSVRSRYPQRQPGRIPNVNGLEAANLISRALKLDGPCMAVNAACASSLQALSLAARALQLGEIDMAIVGGAAYCKLDSLILFSHAQSVSATGSRPFDADADGLVHGEGYVALVIEPLEKALAHNDRIHAVIRGIGMSCDGSGKSLWAPRKEGQIAAMRRAYEDGAAMGRVQYIEAHATSTQLGDATELMALGEALKERLPEGTKIPVGSVKANIGHTIETAGLAGLLKTILSMQHCTIPPAINVRTLNPKIDWAQVPFYAPRTAMPWPEQPDGQPRCAGVNSFGIGGLNVHVVVQEFSPRYQSTSYFAPEATAAPAHKTASNEPIAVIGMGAILPGALDVDAYWELLISGRDPKQNAPASRWNTALAHAPGVRVPFRTPNLLGGFITDFQYDWKTRKIPPKQIANADPLQFMLLQAVEQALCMSGYEAHVNHERTGVYVGVLTAGEFHEQLQMGLRLPEFQQELTRLLRRKGVAAREIRELAGQFGEILLRRMPALMDETGSYTTNTLASRITKTFNLMGGAAAIDAGTASAAAALSASVNTLRAGDCDVVVCAGGQRSMGPTAYELFSLEGRLAMGRPQSPFDVSACGFVPGEGAAAVVLKRLSDARRDGDTVLGLIRGLGVARNDHYETAVKQAVRRGLDAARVETDAISCIETTAQGVPEFDEQEITALRDCFERNPRPDPVPLGAIASQMGQLGACHTMAGLIKIILALQHGQFPGNVGLTQPSPLLTGQKVFTASKNRLSLSGHGHDSPLVAGLNSSVQSQLAYHILVASHEERPPSPKTTGRAEDTRWHIFRLEGQSSPELVDGLNHIGSRAEAAYNSAMTGFGTGGFERLAIVAQSPDDLAEKSQLASRQLMQPQTHSLLQERGIFYFQRRADRPRVAFLFPGQGSQYAGMLQSLIEEFEPAQRAADCIDEVLRRLGYPSVASVLWEEGEKLGKDVWRTQLSLLVADTIFHLCLAHLEIFPDRVAGHSFGENPALLAAGVWDFEQAARATRARCTAIEACRDTTNGVMMSVNAPAGLVEEQLREITGPVYIACYNAQDQTVVGGTRSAVVELGERLKRGNRLTQMIGVPAAFHTPFVEGAKAPWGEALAGLALEPPRVPILSSVHNRYMADPDEIRATLVAQITSPVRYLTLVQRLAQEGMEIFIEVGPHQVLTRLNRRILDGAKVVTIATDQPKKNSVQQLLSVRACVETMGVLERDRDDLTVRMFPRDTSPKSAAVQTSREAGAGAARTRRKTSEVRHEQEGLPATPLNLLELSGTPYQMGLQHGRALAVPILTVLRRYADLAGPAWEDAEWVSEGAAHPQDVFGLEDLDELQGIADGTGVPLETIIMHNLRLHADPGGGMQFAVSGEHNGHGSLIHCTTEAQPLALQGLRCVVRSVQARFPRRGIPHLLFGTVGQAGGFSGVNARGLAVTSAHMLDLDGSNSKGTLHAAVVKRILERAEGMEQAVAIIRATNGVGAWALCVTHHPTDELCYAEYNGNAVRIQRHQSHIFGADHSLLFPSSVQIPARSRDRLSRLKQLLGEVLESSDGIGVLRAQAALHDQLGPGDARETPLPNMTAMGRVNGQVCVVMQPAQGKARVTTGPKTDTESDGFFDLDVRELLAAKQNGSATGHVEMPEKRSREEDSPDASVVEGLRTGEAPVCQRFSLRLVEATPHGGAPLTSLAGPALIVGQNAVADALRRKIEEAGGVALTLPPSEDLEDLLSHVNEFWRLRPVPYLFLLTPCDAEARTNLDPSRWRRRRFHGATVPYFVCQRWYQLLVEEGCVDSASLVGVTALGGDFGFSENVLSAESGAITGLIKALKRELDANGQRGFTAKILDTGADEPVEQTVTAILRELENPDQEIEVSCTGGKRAIVRAVTQPAPSCGTRAGIAKGAVWLVTGGARGITAVVARELAQRYGLKLHLIGSSPLPVIDKSWRGLSEAGLKALRAKVMKEALARGQIPVAAWNRVTTDLEIDRNLEGYAAAGVPFTYHSCDVTNRSAMRDLLGKIRSSAGAIQGILHGAGFESASRFEKKQRELVERTISVKVDGAVNLMELTRDDPIQCFLAFGSVSGRSGGIGQTDYSLANDFLAKLVSWYASQRPGCRAATFHWHAWDEVGMAVHPDRSYVRRYLNVRYMPPREGIEYVVDELRAGVPEREIVITDASRYQDMPEPLKALQRPRPSNSRTGVDKAAATPDVSRLPLVDSIRENRARESITAEIHLDPTKDCFLTEHRFKGRPLMPGVISMAAMAQAASTLLKGSVNVLRNVEFVAPLRFHTSRPQVARVHAAINEAEAACRLSADFVNRAGALVEKDRLHARAIVGTTEHPLPLRSPQSKRPSAWKAFPYPDDGIVAHGELFRCLRAVSVDGREGWGRIVAPSPAFAGSRRGDQWMVPAVLDGAFVLCSVHACIRHGKRVFHVPKGIERLVLGRQCRPSEELYVRVVARPGADQHTMYDFTIFDERNDVIADVFGYTGFTVSQKETT